MFKDRTLTELKKLFKDNDLDYYIKKNKDGFVKVHFKLAEEKDGEEDE